MLTVLQQDPLASRRHLLRSKDQRSKVAAHRYVTGRAIRYQEPRFPALTPNSAAHRRAFTLRCSFQPSLHPVLITPVLNSTVLCTPYCMSGGPVHLARLCLVPVAPAKLGRLEPEVLRT